MCGSRSMDSENASPCRERRRRAIRSLREWFGFVCAPCSLIFARDPVQWFLVRYLFYVHCGRFHTSYLNLYALFISRLCSLHRWYGTFCTSCGARGMGEG